MSRTVPRSTYGKNASCCARLKRWISSMKMTVRVPKCDAFSASDITCLTSLIPELTAENSMNCARVVFAMMCASVVLPVPGGPQKMIEPGSSLSIWMRNGLPAPRICCCPTNSSSDRGRILSASGLVGPRSCNSPATSEKSDTSVVLVVPLSKCLVQQQGRGNSGVQGFHSFHVRDANPSMRLVRKRFRDTAALVADDDGDLLLQVSGGRDLATMRIGDQDAKAEGCQLGEVVHLEYGEAEQRPSRSTH